MGFVGIGVAEGSPGFNVAVGAPEVGVRVGVIMTVDVFPTVDVNVTDVFIVGDADFVNVAVSALAFVSVNLGVAEA